MFIEGFDKFKLTTNRYCTYVMRYCQVHIRKLDFSICVTYASFTEERAPGFKPTYTDILEWTPIESVGEVTTRYSTR